MRLEAVGKVDDFVENEPKEVQIGARRIAIYMVEGKFYALKNICPHQEVLLHHAPPQNGRAVCKGHGWEFDLKTGKCLRGQKDHKVAVYPTKVEDGILYIDLG